MVGLMSKKDAFAEGLRRLPGWDRQRAEEHFFNYAPMFEIDNETAFAAEEAERLGKKYGVVVFVPLYYTIEDNLLSLISVNR
jgi:carbonic anhydrase